MRDEWKGFIDACATVGIMPDPAQIDALDAYYRILTEKNKVMNLTAITSFEDVWKLHFLDSLAILFAARDEDGTPILKQTGKETVLDIGTGAGFPGVVLKIFCPGLRLTLLDAQEKRVLFLEEVAEALSLRKDGELRIVHARAEDLARDNAHRARYDLAVSRAVAKCAVLTEYAVPFLKRGAVFAAYKSSAIEEELSESTRALQLLGAEIAAVPRYTLPGTDVERSLVCIRKTSETDDRYPRRASKIQKSPL
ncbi:MAG: 16S rRNA (guanine(527)-N(7))-methyltransferase RsmG [Lachnospiraceae bacterium]|nr:16S rRNA (guanine(527)-N(7))-methyltransferase RsmG [Lachnospiraceae bacterium]